VADDQVTKPCTYVARMQCASRCHHCDKVSCSRKLTGLCQQDSQVRKGHTTDCRSHQVGI